MAQLDVPPLEATVTAVLEGGPTDLPQSSRRRMVTEAEDKIKIRHRGGYEHFERADAVAAEALVRFRWTMRTRIAE